MIYLMWRLLSGEGAPRAPGVVDISPDIYLLRCNPLIYALDEVLFPHHLKRLVCRNRPIEADHYVRTQTPEATLIELVADIKFTAYKLRAGNSPD